MKFAKVVFWIAGIWGVAVLAPSYFMYDRIGRQNPPGITHPEYYFGFLGVALSWQFVFLVIATDPLRYRPIIALSVLEKASYVLTVALLFLLGHMTGSGSAIAVPDATLAVLFVISFLKTRPDDRIANHDTHELITSGAPPGQPTSKRKLVQQREREDNEECRKHDDLPG